MTTSGTYAFNPSLGQIVLYAYNLCGIRGTALLQEHMTAANMAANLVLGDFSNRGVNLWKVNLVTTPLVAGTATYAVDPSIVVILDAYVSTTTGTNTIDRIILPVSRSEYAAYSNKDQTGTVTTYWNDRLLSPSITLYLVPDGSQPYLRYYAVQQIQDAATTNGQTLDIPYLWMKAFAYALATELATIWAPDKLPIISPAADKAYNIAAETNIEIAQQYISPMLSGYYRP